MTEPKIIRELDHGLILRRSTPDDAEPLARFNSWVHGDMQNNRLEEKVGVWTRDLLTRPHPTFDPGDFTIVEDTSNGQIISSLNLISQIWSYAGIPFKVGRPELVGTHPDYRHRGLVRAQFEVVHQWSAEREEMLQAITGIPFYYRQFGYEMALSLDGSRVGYMVHVTDLSEGESEPYLIRPAVESDLPFIAEVYAYGCKRSLVSSVWDMDLWRYELLGKSSDNVNRSELRLVTTPEGEQIGFLAHSSERWGAAIGVIHYELKPGVSWVAVTPTVMRYLKRTGLEYKPNTGDAPLGAFVFQLGEAHPVYEVMGARLPKVNPSYAYYLRLPDLPAFVRHISPALEARLATSLLAGHSGELKISFYRNGLRMIFERGHLSLVESWVPAPEGHSGDAAFPGLTFLQILFGYRSLADLRYAYPDCFTANEDVRVLINTLFPRLHSNVWPIS
jgi:hypothetical protein